MLDCILQELLVSHFLDGQLIEEFGHKVDELETGDALRDKLWLILMKTIVKPCKWRQIEMKNYETKHIRPFKEKLSQCNIRRKYSKPIVLYTSISAQSKASLAYRTVFISKNCHQNLWWSCRKTSYIPPPSWSQTEIKRYVNILPM